MEVRLNPKPTQVEFPIQNNVSLMELQTEFKPRCSDPLKSIYDKGLFAQRDFQ